MSDPRTEVEVLSTDEQPTHIEQLNIPGVLDGTVRLLYDEEGRVTIRVNVYRGYVQGEPPDTPMDDVDDFVIAGTTVDLPHHQDIRTEADDA